MKTKPISIILVICCTFLNSYAQILYKIGSQSLSPDFLKIITNVPIITGLFLYFIAALVLVYALKKGELSILYPFLALSYIWVSLLSTRFLPVPEQMNSYKWIGVAIIILGVSFIGIGSSTKNNEEMTLTDRKNIS
jgi:uncharacterized membrane protein